MHWIVATLVSAFFLGCYELFTKQAVRDNAVLPVLFFSNVCSTAVWTLLMGVHALHPTALPARSADLKWIPPSRLEKPAWSAASEKVFQCSVVSIDGVIPGSIFEVPV